ncbi:hypothetical protein IAI39_11460, partial [Streptococcus pseudopneumoniae]|uniref:hypothetical protein n=1 Tax=Streptococcus pseudopneumoniae TaxID=257758 RepID=UPI0018B036D0
MTNRTVYAALVVALVALVLAGGAIAYTAVSNNGRISDIQESRYDGNLNACRIRNQEHTGIQR